MYVIYLARVMWPKKASFVRLLESFIKETVQREKVKAKRKNTECWVIQNTISECEEKIL